MVYVKGFSIDRDKIKAILKTTDDNDSKIHNVMHKVILSVNRTFFVPHTPSMIQRG